MSRKFSSRRKSIRAKLEKEEEEKRNDPQTQLKQEAEKLTNALLFIQDEPVTNKRRGSLRRRSLVPELDNEGDDISTNGAIKSLSRRGSRLNLNDDPSSEDEATKSMMDVAEITKKSTRKSMRKKKDKNRPYPKKKGRKFKEGQEAVEDNAAAEDM